MLFASTLSKTTDLTMVITLFITPVDLLHSRPPSWRAKSTMSYLDDTVVHTKLCRKILLEPIESGTQLDVFCVEVSF